MFLESIIIIIYSTALILIFMYALAQLNLLFNYINANKTKNDSPEFDLTNPNEIPFVTIQLPVFNEMYVMDMEDFSDFKNRRVNKLLVIQNSLTEKIVEYLKMSDDSLSKFTGTVTPLEYKKQLLILFMKLSE